MYIEIVIDRANEKFMWQRKKNVFRFLRSWIVFRYRDCIRRLICRMLDCRQEQWSTIKLPLYVHHVYLCTCAFHYGHRTSEHVQCIRRVHTPVWRTRRDEQECKFVYLCCRPTSVITSLLGRCRRGNFVCSRATRNVGLNAVECRCSKDGSFL